MNEAYLKSRLRDALKAAMPGAVVVRHEDKFSAGVPDLSVTWNGITSWVEVKYERPGRRAVPTALQNDMLLRLRAAGAPAWLLTYVEANSKGPRYVRLNGSTQPGQEFGRAGGFDHETIARVIREDHERRSR